MWLLTPGLVVRIPFRDSFYLLTSAVPIPYIVWGSADTNNVSKDQPRILLWTTFHGLWPGELDPTMTGEVRTTNCPFNCSVTNDRDLLESSDAIVFHMRDIYLDDLPPTRTYSQKWVFWTMEAPPYSETGYLQSIPNMFNWTMSYRSDSDVVLPYGKFVDSDGGEANRDYASIWKSKTDLAVWMVSHCNTSSARELFVEELSRHMNVNVYGYCGEYVCPKDRTHECYEYFEKRYFFMLAMENSVCKDYVTEKFFLPLMYDIVPVVLGGADYRDIAPSGSYIDALKFETPERLAEYLKHVAQNFQAYKSYLSWKAHTKVVPWVVSDFCALCTKLHSKYFKRKTVYGNIHLWWHNYSYCRTFEDEMDAKAQAEAEAGSGE